MLGRSRGAGTSRHWVQPGEREFSPFFLGAVLTGHRIHPKSALDQQALAHLHAILQILGKISPSHHLQLTSGVIGTQRIKTNLHFSDWRLIVLGVSQGGSLKNIHLKYAVIHPRPGR